MKLRSIYTLTLILVACLRAWSLGQEQPEAQQPGLPTSQPVLVDVSDKAGLAAEWNAKGSVFFINFQNTQESRALAVAFEKRREALEQSFAGDLGKALTGAKVRIRGTLKDYKGRPEVVIDMPSQITILETAPSTQPATQPSSEK